jgi:hypothetical protein
MVLYNVTVSIDDDVHEEWLSWMKEVHIPEVMATGKFTENRICRILGFEEAGISYSIQYLSPDMEHYESYQRDFAPELQRKHTVRYEGKFAAFRTVLDIVHEHKL